MELEVTLVEKSNCLLPTVYVNLLPMPVMADNGCAVKGAVQPNSCRETGLELGFRNLAKLQFFCDFRNIKEIFEKAEKLNLKCFN